MLGGASIGCLFKEVKPDQARECIERAVELGIRYVRPESVPSPPPPSPNM